MRLLVRLPLALLSIRWRFLFLLLCTCAVLLSASVYRALDRRAADVAAAMAQQEVLSAAMADRQRLGFENTQRLLGLLSQAVDLSTLINDPQCERRLAALVSQDPQVANVFLALPNGDTRCHLVRGAQALNIANRSFMPRALVQDKPVVGAAQVGGFTGKHVLPVAQRIADAQGRVQGLIVVAMDLSWVTRELPGSRAAGPSMAGLVDAHGRVITRRPQPASPQGAEAFESAAFEQLRQQGPGAALSLVFPDGERRLLTLYRFAETLAGPIYFFVGQRQADITAAADRQMVMDLSLAALLVVVAFAVAWWGGEHWLIRPLRRIGLAARELGAGNHLSRTGLAPQPGEVGALAAAFDDMAAALASNNNVVRLNRALQLLSKSNQALVRGQQEAALLDDICRIAVQVGGYRLAWVGFAEHDAEKSVRLIAQFGVNDGYLKAAQISWGDNALGQGPTGMSIRLGQPQINRDFATENKMAPWRVAALAHGFRSSAAFPLMVDGQTLGALTIYSAAPDAFNEQEVSLLGELAADLAFGIHSRRVQQAHVQTQRRLEGVLEATVQAVATTVEFRDPYTAGHQRRVASLAVAMARRMGLSDHEVQGIHLAGIVHDIGKIQVPEAILAKPGRLTEDEYQVLRRHPQAGHDILKDIAFPWPIADMVLQHHERLDGSGYPLGLAQDQIILGARILAVADVVEAMCLDRPYRAGLGVAAALAEIQSGRGRLYDPQAADICVELLSHGEFSFDAA